ncbi:MAG: hypothetical protein WBJ81_01175 [Rickettsiales bacterium]
MCFGILKYFFQSCFNKDNNSEATADTTTTAPVNPLQRLHDLGLIGGNNEFDHRTSFSSVIIDS